VPGSNSAQHAFLIYSERRGGKAFGFGYRTPTGLQIFMGAKLPPIRF
jgi:hypothetical protein